MEQVCANVVAVGLTQTELETLDSTLQLSNRYQLISANGDVQAAVVLVNIDNPEAILQWKSRLDKPGQGTVIIAENPGRYGPITYLARRFLQRPCFAKQVLAALDHVAPPPPVVAAPAAAAPPRRSLLAECRETLSRSLGRWFEGVRDEPEHNPYYS